MPPVTHTHHMAVHGLHLGRKSKCLTKVYCSFEIKTILFSDGLFADSCYFYNDLSVYEGFGGVVLAKEEGERIAEALGPINKSVILQNHG
jgi:hypothetical protein